MTLINCLGTKVDDYIIPPFKLIEGDYLTISVPYLFNSKIDSKILDAITSSVNKEDSNLSVNGNISTVKDSIGEVSLWKKIFCNFSLNTYLQEKYNLNKIEIEKLLSKNNLHEYEKIFSIGANEKKIISVQIALLKYNHIIVDTIGMDYKGIEMLYQILQNREKEQTIIEIRYPTFNDFSFFEKTSKIVIETI